MTSSLVHPLRVRIITLRSPEPWDSRGVDLWQVQVPGCSLVLSALLTKKLPTFLSRLYEMSGGCEKILPVSGSLRSNLKLLRMILLTEDGK